MAFRYSFGGLSVISNTPLEGLREAPEQDRANRAADIGMTLAAGAAPAAQEILFQWPGRYGLSLGRLGSDWLFSSRLGAAFRVCPDGRRIVAYAHLSPDIGFIDVLARRVLPRVALLHGAIGIHAAAVANATGALLLSAPSGFGKSTLAAVMSRRPGWTALSDDISLLGSSGGRTLVLPAARGICLRPDSQRALGLGDMHCRSMPGYEDKLWFEPDPGPAAAARPLSAFVVLSRRADVDAPTLKPLAPLEAFMLATNQLIHFNPKASADGAIAEMMQRLSRALDGVPSYVLACPDRFEALGPGADLLAGLAQ